MSQGLMNEFRGVCVFIILLLKVNAAVMLCDMFSAKPRKVNLPIKRRRGALFFQFA